MWAGDKKCYNLLIYNLLKKNYRFNKNKRTHTGKAREARVVFLQNLVRLTERS